MASRGKQRGRKRKPGNRNRAVKAEAERMGREEKPTKAATVKQLLRFKKAVKRGNGRTTVAAIR